MLARHHVPLVAAALLLGGVVMAPLTGCEPAAIAPAEAIVTTLRVEGMVCESCEQAISAQLSAIEGVQSVRASHSDSSVEIRHDPARAPIDELAAVIEKIGYTVVR